jgi:hypothetical protein
MSADCPHPPTSSCDNQKISPDTPDVSLGANYPQLRTPQSKITDRNFRGREEEGKEGVSGGMRKRERI